MKFILEMSLHWIPDSAKKNKHVAAVAKDQLTLTQY